MPYNPPKKNTAYIFHTAVLLQSDPKLFRDTPTLAAGDAKVRIDDTAAVNLATLPVATGKIIKVSLSAAEMNADNVTVILSDQSGAEWCDQIISLQPTTNQYDSVGLSSAERDAIADAILKRDWSLVTGEASRSILNALRFIRNKWTLISNILSVKKEDDSTEAWNATVTSTAGAAPITTVDPS